MNRAAFPSDSFAVNASSEPTMPQQPPTAQQAYDYLRKILTPEELLKWAFEFHRLAGTHHRHSSSSSKSLQSTRTSVFSHPSIASSSSAYSQDYALVEPDQFGPLWPETRSGTPLGIQFTSLPPAPTSAYPMSLPTDLQTPGSSASTPAPVADRLMCFACNKILSKQSTLSRHRKEQCEPDKIAYCSLCPPGEKWYYSKERLERHHLSAHGATSQGPRCQHGCSKDGGLSDACKADLPNSFQNHATKKAWGCPYCVACFSSREHFDTHCTRLHRDPNDTTPWLFSTMIKSLLQQPCLAEARSRYSWHGCDWSEKSSPHLRSALERRRLPDAVQARPDSYHFTNAEALIYYAHCQGLAGHGDTDLLVSDGVFFPSSTTLDLSFSHPPLVYEQPAGYQTNMPNTLGAMLPSQSFQPAADYQNGQTPGRMGAVGGRHDVQAMGASSFGVQPSSSRPSHDVSTSYCSPRTVESLGFSDDTTAGSQSSGLLAASSYPDEKSQSPFNAPLPLPPLHADGSPGNMGHGMVTSERPTLGLKMKKSMKKLVHRSPSTPMRPYTSHSDYAALAASPLDNMRPSDVSGRHRPLSVIMKDAP